MNCPLCKKEISWVTDKEMTNIYYKTGCSSCHCELFSDTSPQEVNAYFLHLPFNGEMYQWISIRKDWQLRPTKDGTTQIRIRQGIDTNIKYHLLIIFDEWIPPQSKEFHTNFINRIINLKAFL